jgi:16S rRNA (guanine527-N7)-methyltransferase
LEKFEQYLTLLLAENQKYNLTSITDPAEIQAKHFADSLFLLDIAALEQGATLLDVGAGAGFPGVPLALARPDLRLALLESNAKMAAFLRLLRDSLAMPWKILNERAELAAHNPALRGQFDWVASRAVASLPMLCELCLPFCKVGGCFVAYKGTAARAAQELAQSQNAIRQLGANRKEMVTKQTAYGERTFILIEKISQTPLIYPRNFSGMRKKPL